MGESSNIPKYRHPQSIRRSPFPIKCYVCNKVDHKAKQCRQTKTHYNKPSQREYSLTNRHSIANAGVVMPSITHVCSIYKSEAQLRCGCSVPVLGNACVVYQQNIPTSMGYDSKEVERVLRDTGCSDDVNQGVELQCHDTISTQIEEDQTSTTDSCENETYRSTYYDIDSDQLVSNIEVSPANVDASDTTQISVDCSTTVETCASGKRNKDSVTFKPSPVPKQCDVNTSHRYFSSPFKEGGLRVMRELWEKERIT